jgi:hypothetical protein
MNLLSWQRLKELSEMDRTPIYLDSNVIIDMADGQEDELIGLILRSIYIGPYCYPFSAEQIAEITQQEMPERNKQRLMFLGDISRNIYFENSVNQLGFKTEHPITVHGTINEVPFAQNVDALFANLVTHEQQVEARSAFGLSAEKLNNLSPQEAIQAIDSSLANFEYEIKEGHVHPPKSLADFLKFNEENIQEHYSNPGTQLQNTRIVGLFSLIDTFGFWSDLKRTYLKGSRLPDSRHAFNGSYFNKVISRDKRFLKKSEATYSYFNIAAETMSTEDFKYHLREIL